jgi:hypothetical protein
MKKEGTRTRSLFNTYTQDRYTYLVRSSRTTDSSFDPHYHHLPSYPLYDRKKRTIKVKARKSSYGHVRKCKSHNTTIKNTVSSQQPVITLNNPTYIHISSSRREGSIRKSPIHHNNKISQKRNRAKG